MVLDLILKGMPRDAPLNLRVKRQLKVHIKQLGGQIIIFNKSLYLVGIQQVLNKSDQTSFICYVVATQ